MLDSPKGTDSRKDLIFRAASFGKTCDEYRRKWEESGRDPSVLSEFIKSHCHAVYVPWVRDELQRLMIFETNKIQDIFKRGPGESADQNKLKSGAMDLMIYDKVNEKLSEGMNKSEAFETVSKTKILDEYLNAGTIKNRYYRAAKAKPEVYLFEDSESIILALAPAKVEVTLPGSDRPKRFYGRWTIATAPKNRKT